MLLRTPKTKVIKYLAGETPSQGFFCKRTFPGTPNSRWPFFRYLPKKLAIFYSKFF